MTPPERAGNAGPLCATSTVWRKWACGRPTLGKPGRAGQRRLLRPPEDGAMGDEMDAMIPEREMKVRDWPGPRSLP